MEQFMVRNEFERIVEYPFLFKNLNPNLGDKILDIGCVESPFAIKMAELGYESWGVDYRKYPYSHKNLKVLQDDIMNIVFPENYFDWITNISTQEHIGIGFRYYGDPEYGNKEEVDAFLFDKYYRSLKPGGKMILTIPFGKPGYTTHFHRLKMYGKDEVEKMIKQFRVIESEYWYLEDWNSHVPNTRVKTTPEEVAQHTDFSFYPTKGTSAFFLEKQ